MSDLEYDSQFTSLGEKRQEYIREEVRRVSMGHFPEAAVSNDSDSDSGSESDEETTRTHSF